MRSIRPDFSALDIPSDVWSQPFWAAAAEHRLATPRCGDCRTFRWPAGPFCPNCRSQLVDWVDPGPGRIYSFTVLPVRTAEEGAPPQVRIPVLVEFPGAPGVRIVSCLVDAPPDAVAIGAAVEAEWLAASNATVPVFRLRNDGDNR